MGCDIHGRIQRRYSPKDVYEDVGEIEDSRNYRVFAMLADVRNGFGFAGTKTHEPVIPISPPRGLPNPLYKGLRWDGAKHVEAPYDDLDDDGNGVWFGDHSHSWLTLSEVLAWDGWDKPLAMTGVVDAAEFQRLEREGGLPESWSGGVFGGDTKIVSADEARAGVPHTHVQYEWQAPFRYYARLFDAWLNYQKLKYDWLLEKDPAAVRLIFGFDS